MILPGIRSAYCPRLCPGCKGCNRCKYVNWQMREQVPHLCHQEPFNCCAETAASGNHGSSIESRPIPGQLIPSLRFGPARSRQKPLKVNAKGELTTVSVAGIVDGNIRHGMVTFGPLAVEPTPEGNDIGGALIKETIKLSKEAGAAGK